jgi:hypothetical protein
MLSPSRSRTTEQAPPSAGQDWQYIFPASSTQVPQLLPSGCGAQVQLSAKAEVLAKESATTTTAKLNSHHLI